jgi:hypothetical protein
MSDQESAAPTSTVVSYTVPAKAKTNATVTALAAPPASGSVANPNQNPVIASVEITPCFVGTGWQSPPMAGYQAQLEAFLAVFVRSSLIGILKQYSVPNFQIGNGSVNPGVFLPIALAPVIEDSDVQTYLSTAIAAGQLPAANANSLYVAFFPQGTTIHASGIGNSCDPNGHCGYHDDMNGTPYAVIPWLDCGPCCPPPLQPFQAVTASASHEICEAITDPVASPPANASWQDPSGNEVADLCNTGGWQTHDLDGSGFVVQRVWSNASGKCE